MTTTDKVRFLSSPDAYPDHPPVTAVETHMSWVFLAGGLVYKLKKPVRYPFLDFSTLRRRRRHCIAELSLNSRLAPGVYRGLVPLKLTASGKLHLDGPGETVEWLIEMERLPEAEMLDSRIAAGKVTKSDIISVAGKLGGFYAHGPSDSANGTAYIHHLMSEAAVNREILVRPDSPLDQARTMKLVADADILLGRARPAILERASRGYLVEGHGDLRPEHICLTGDLPIIDCLEFDRNMRLLDPYDEVNYLGLECEYLGAGWIRPVLLEALDGHLGHRPEPRVLATYGAFRAILRARLCIAHLLDPVSMGAEHWPRLAERYLDIAEQECARASD